MVNKFLYHNGGSETYMFKLGEHLTKLNHEVQYFGMEHHERCVGNNAEQYTANMDFHAGSKLSKLTYPIKTIYSREAKSKITAVLNDFKPDVIHLNNFNFQLTPSIIYAVRDYRKKVNNNVKLIFTAHDYQLVCPNHMMHKPSTNENCEACVGGKFINCTKNRCIHGSLAKSAIGTLEGYIYNKNKIYSEIDALICCSEFMKSKITTNPLFSKKAVTLHNFIDKKTPADKQKEDYVLYFGRFSSEKGINLLLDAVSKLPNIHFVFAGSGPLEDRINELPNAENVGFKTGKELDELISRAKFSIYPSIWYENCPFSVMESISLGTPVIASDIGGIPELIDNGVTGMLFKAGNSSALADCIEKLYNNTKLNNTLADNCLSNKYLTIDDYADKYFEIIERL